MRAPMGSVLIVPGGSSPARALPGLGGQGGRRLAASIGGEAGRGTRPRGRRGQLGQAGQPAGDQPALGRQGPVEGVGELVGGGEAGPEHRAHHRPGRGPHDQLGRAGVPSRGLGEGGEHTGVERTAHDATRPERKTNRHGGHARVPAGVGGQNGWWWSKCARAASSIGRPVAKMPIPPNKDASLPEHPDLAAEQAYIVHAYDCLDEARVSASRLESMVEVSPRGGTNQARFERDVIWDTILARLRELDIGDASLVFGRIDHEADEAAPSDNGTYYIGRIAVADQSQEPVVIDWRAPVAEPFYRATGRLPMGLSRRRHFATRGRTLLGIEDELFGEAAERLGIRGQRRARRGERLQLAHRRPGHVEDRQVWATSSPPSRASRTRSSAPSCGGVLVVQGGPGTGKTVVALHRAAYLLYTHRFPLEGQGVLVVGPNRLFLGYIDQVLPSLGEAGVELAVLADLIPDQVTVGRLRRSARGSGQG